MSKIVLDKLFWEWFEPKKGIDKIIWFLNWSIEFLFEGINDTDLPPRPWAQQAENENSIILDEKSKSLKVNRIANVEEILYTEKPFASVLLEGM